MKTLIAILISLGSATAFASGSGVPLPHTCYFNVPTVSSMQTEGPYVGHGESRAAARAAALRACKNDLDFWSRGTCDAYFARPAHMECNFNLDAVRRY